jgi:hypothetical protein
MFAFLNLAAQEMLILLVIVLILGGLIFAVVRGLTGDKQDKED